MNTKFLFITALMFFFSWKAMADEFLLFCALFAAAMGICVFIYRMENPYRVSDKQSD
jgi:hypothetical protein